MNYNNQDNRLPCKVVLSEERSAKLRALQNKWHETGRGPSARDQSAQAGGRR